MSNNDYAKVLLGLAVIGSCIAFAAADLFNRLHLFNPDWPPHARFHNAMQGTTLFLVSLASFTALSGPLTWPKAELAALSPITFWLGLFVAWCVPGTSVYASKALQDRRLPWNILVAAVFLLLTATGLWFARTSM